LCKGIIQEIILMPHHIFATFDTAFLAYSRAIFLLLQSRK
jgi:hypothetical protein